MKIYQSILFMVGLIFSLSLFGCSGPSSVAREYSYNADDVYDASIAAITQMHGTIKVADKKSQTILFSVHEPWASISPNDVAIDIKDLGNNQTRVIASVNNSSIQLIDYKTKERALIDFEEKLLLNLQKRQNNNL